MPTGYWESEYLLRPADLTIVGAGIVGMSAALHFKKLRPHAHVRIIERAPISAGGTTRNAGFACFGSAGEWLDDLQVLGMEKLQELVESRAEGLSDMLQLLGEEAIGMSWSGGWELFSERDTDVQLAQKVIRALPEINETVAPILAKVLGPSCTIEFRSIIKNFCALLPSKVWPRCALQPKLKTPSRLDQRFQL